MTPENTVVVCACGCGVKFQRNGSQKYFSVRCRDEAQAVHRRATIKPRLKMLYAAKQSFKDPIHPNAQSGLLDASPCKFRFENGRAVIVKTERND